MTNITQCKFIQDKESTEKTAESPPSFSSLLHCKDLIRELVKYSFASELKSPTIISIKPVFVLCGYLRKVSEYFPVLMSSRKTLWLTASWTETSLFSS